VERRTLLGAACAVSLTACASRQRPPLNFVLVHGAWHGAWCWSRITPMLARTGAAVTAVTLPGLAQRRTELSGRIDLDSHIEEAVAAVRRQRDPAVLVGHSYGGFVITGAADRLAREGRLRSLIYLDAFVPGDGERVADYMPPAARETLEANAAAGNFAYPKVSARAFGITDPADAAWVDSQLTDQPAGTYLQPLRLRNASVASPRRSYIACNQPAMAVFDPTKQRLRTDARWTYREMATGHDAMVTQPQALADLLLALA